MVKKLQFYRQRENLVHSWKKKQNCTANDKKWLTQKQPNWLQKRAGRQQQHVSMFLPRARKVGFQTVMPQWFVYTQQLYGWKQIIAWPTSTVFLLQVHVTKREFDVCEEMTIGRWREVLYKCLTDGYSDMIIVNLLRNAGLVHESALFQMFSTTDKHTMINDWRLELWAD